MSCKRCVMNETAVDFVMTQTGCNYCDDLVARMAEQNAVTQNFDADSLCAPNQKFDAIIGVSGGVDSSYVLAKAVEMGIRPLAVHLDNGWNSEISVRNIRNIVAKTNTPLYTHVIDWQEYRDIQKAFFDNDLLDIELIMDNAMLKLNYALAKKYGVKYILTGDNTATEGMTMPENWFHFKLDGTNIKNVAKRAGIKLKTLPILTTLQWLYYERFLGIQRFRFLDHIGYNKASALSYLIEKFNYTPYPYKHYESVFTRFYQGYILPQKFNIDKRRIHLSTLVISGEISREEALEHLESSPYNELAQMLTDKAFVCEKLGFTSDAFESYMRRPAQSHFRFGNERYIRNTLISLKRLKRKLFRSQ